MDEQEFLCSRQVFSLQSECAYVFVTTCNKSVNLESYTAMRKAVKRAERGFYTTKWPTAKRSKDFLKAYIFFPNISMCYHILKVFGKSDFCSIKELFDQT